MARKNDELAAAIEAIVANSRKTSELASRFAEDYERLSQDRSTVPEVEATEEARLEAGLQELTSAARLLSVAWGVARVAPAARRDHGAGGGGEPSGDARGPLQVPHRRVPAAAGAGAAASRMSHRTYQERGYCTRAGYARLDVVS